MSEPTTSPSLEQQSLAHIFVRPLSADLHDLRALQLDRETLPSTPDSQLYGRVIERVIENQDVQLDLLSIRRWHAYYRHQGNRDMNGIGHAVNTVQITRTLAEVDCAAGLLASEELAALVLTAFIHDFGEIYLGNATYGGKSEAHEKKEIAAFRRNIELFFPDFSVSERHRLEALYLDIAMNKDMTHKLASYFNMIEVTGYVNFSLEAFEEKSPLFQWEVLGWRILRYHFFREGKDIPVHIERSHGSRSYWNDKIKALDEFVNHFSGFDQEEFLRTNYRRTNLPDVDTVKPIDFSAWEGLRARIVCS
jgi:hypothetical protein